MLGQGAVVLFVSDGLDRDAGEGGLAREIERLHKSCRRLIWLNPLLRYDQFQPKSLGIRAILPHVDEFRRRITWRRWPSWSRRQRPAGGDPCRHGQMEGEGGMTTELLNSGPTEAAAWRDAGRGVALATVVTTWALPRPVGSQLAVDQGGRMIGSVSGGCIEGAVVKEAQEVIADGKPRLLDFGVSNEQAWEVGLACGGKVQVYLERVE